MPAACVFLAPASPRSPGAETREMQLQAQRRPQASIPPAQAAPAPPLLPRCWGAPSTPLLRRQGLVVWFGSPLVLPHTVPFPREPQSRVPACTQPHCQVKEQSPRAAGEKYFTDL